MKISLLVLLLTFGVSALATGIIQQTDWVKFGQESNTKTQFPWFVEGRINWEAEKQKRELPVVTIVIHHTEKQFVWDMKNPDVGIWELSNLQKERLYRGRFERSKDPEPFIFGSGMPMQSGHFLILFGKKEEVFVAYHNLILTNGTFVKMLDDNAVGWHSGDWDKNQTSVAIALDGDFTEIAPNSKMFNMLAKRIAYFRSIFNIKEIVAHHEVRPQPTLCPGKWFTNDVKALLWSKSLEYLNKKKFK